MKNFVKVLLVFVMFVGFSSCDKEEDEPTTSSYPNPTPTFSDADGLLAAVQVISYQSAPIIGEIAVYADVATAAFFDGASTFFDGGTVSVNSYELDQVDNNAYVLPGIGSTVIDFDFSTSSSNAWSVGGAANVPSFNYTTSDEMPGDVKFDGDYSTVNTSSDLTVSIESAPFNTDSILFVVAFENTTLTKTVAPNVTSATFTAAELSGASGTGVVQVAAYNFEFSVQGGKTYYFINESVVSEFTNFN